MDCTHKPILVSTVGALSRLPFAGMATNAWEADEVLPVDVASTLDSWIHQSSADAGSAVRTVVGLVDDDLSFAELERAGLTRVALDRGIHWEEFSDFWMLKAALDERNDIDVLTISSHGAIDRGRFVFRIAGHQIGLDALADLAVPETVIFASCHSGRHASTVNRRANHDLITIFLRNNARSVIAAPPSRQ